MTYLKLVRLSVKWCSKCVKIVTIFGWELVGREELSNSGDLAANMYTRGSYK
jgi:hypothetical protein